MADEPTENKPENPNPESELDKWFTSSQNNAHIPNRWIKIGDEIYARKSLLLAAAKDLENKKIENSVILASTDVFVEKAQKFLTQRAMCYTFVGAFLSLATVIILGIASFWLYELDFSEAIKKYDKIDSYIFTLLVLKATTSGAIFAAAIYFSIALSRALLHEGTVLFNRRHALRFGRLYVYLKNGKIEFKELEEAFKWNAEFTSAFKDIKPEKASSHPAQKILEEVTNIMKQGSKLAGTITGRIKEGADLPLYNAEKDEKS